MAKKKEKKTVRKTKKILKITPKKIEINPDIDVFKDSFVTKYEVLPPKKNNYYERQFIISSISGNQYTVTVNKLVNCTCPVCTFKAKRCHHIEFVMNDILHEKYPRIYYDNRALDSLFKYLPGHVRNSDNEKDENNEKNEEWKKLNKCLRIVVFNNLIIIFKIKN